MKKTFKYALITMLIVLAFVVIYKIRVRPPEYDTFDKQKWYAECRFNHVMEHPRWTKLKLSWDWVLDAYNTLYRLYPKEAYKNVDNLKRTGDCYYLSKDYDNAVKFYQLALNAFLENNYMKDEYKLSEDKRANARFLQYQWLRKLHIRVADSYFKKKDFDAGIAEINKILTSYNYNWDQLSEHEKYRIIGETYEDLANVYSIMLKNYDTAISIYSKEMSLFPNHLVIPLVESKIGDMYRLKGEYEKAREMYKKVIAEYKDTVNADFARDGLKALEKIGK